jgi:hypothetical protein
MNTVDAAYHTVHDYPGGSESLGPRVGISPAVLRNKVNPNNDTHHLTLAEAVRMVDITDDERILQAWARARGYMLVKPPAGRSCDMAVLEQVVNLGIANGQFMATINEALADNKITRKEISKIRDAEHVLQTTAATVTGSLEGMSDD